MNILGSACLLFMAASSAALLLPHARPIPVPVWLLIPLGFFAGFGLMFRMGWPGFYEGCLVLVILGLGCARVNGARAALVLLNGGIILASAAIDPGMYLSPGPFARILLLEGIIVLVTILAPILMLRARSVLAQGLALVLPLAAYAAVFSFALLPASGLAMPMFQFSIGQALAIASPFIALTGIVAVVTLLYSRFSSAQLRPQR